MAEEFYPKFYASMGDVLYNDAKGFELLLQSDYFKKEFTDIRAYLLLSSETKKLGYKIDSKNRSPERIEYVKALRFLNLQNTLISAKISRRLEVLFKQSQYDYLSTLRNNRALCVKESTVLTRALERKNEIPNRNSSIDINTLFYKYKKELLKAREDENSSECLNDLTALYHYFIEIKVAQEEYNCKDFDEAYEQMRGYYHAIKMNCTKGDDIDQADIVYKSYLSKRCY